METIEIKSYNEFKSLGSGDINKTKKSVDLNLNKNFQSESVLYEEDSNYSNSNFKTEKNEKDNVITHQIKQKKMIYDQINEELESLKEEAEKKRKYNIQKKSSITSQNSGTSCESKKSKVGRFLKGLFG